MKTAFYAGSIICYIGMVATCYSASKGELVESVANGFVMAIGAVAFTIAGVIVYTFCR